MENLDQLCSRYLQDAIPIRLGGLAANLARIASFSKYPGHQEAVADILVESKWFIEWTAAELEVPKAAELVGLQLKLAQWDWDRRQNWHDENWRNMLADNARRWSEYILEMSGLLPQARRDSAMRE